MSSMPLKQALPALLAVALLVVLAGCGSDSSGESTSSVAAPIPTVTSPIATTTASTTPAPGGKKQGQTTNTTGGVSGGCTIPDAYQDMKYSGLSCTAAVAVATAWDQNGKDCNTVDNPNVDEGYHRTCSVEGFTCTAKRDVHSDARFVSCQGTGQGIRFTWLPA